jgi:hypothetical protein
MLTAIPKNIQLLGLEHSADHNHPSFQNIAQTKLHAHRTISEFNISLCALPTFMVNIKREGSK